MLGAAIEGRGRERTVSRLGKLYWGLIGLVIVFAASMSFATLAVYDLQWWPGAVAGGIFVVFVALGGLVVPGSLRSLSGGRLRTAKAAVQWFGSMFGLEFFIMAIITWALAKRTVGSSNGYTVLGLLIFLGLVGVGIQGVLAMSAWFVHVRNQAIVVPAREATLESGRGPGLSVGHGDGGHG